MRFPLDKKVNITSDSNSFSNVDFSTHTEIPTGDHVGAYAHVRKFHTHEGVDLYCPHGTPVYAMEDGTVTKIGWFTGPKYHESMIWWNDTQAIIVNGEHAILYGEIEVIPELSEGDTIKEGQLLGHVLTVLKKDKGRPMSMLHVELHKPECSGFFCWDAGVEKPNCLLDPTDLLIKSIEERA